MVRVVQQVNSLELRFHQKKTINRTVLLVFVFLSFLFMVLERQYPVVPKTIRNAVIDTFLPALDVLSSPVDSLIYMRSSLEELAVMREQNSLLLQENERLRSAYLHVLQMRAENSELRRLLNIVHQRVPATITARIVGSMSGAFMETAIIDAGTDHGVGAYMPVMNEKGLVGRVVDVGERTARILLLTDLNSRIPVITNTSRERAVVVGGNSTLLTLMYLQEDHAVRPGEMVVTSGDGEYFPANIPVGQVVQVNEAEVKIAPFADWGKLEFVSILKRE